MKQKIDSLEKRIASIEKDLLNKSNIEEMINQRNESFIEQFELIKSLSGKVEMLNDRISNSEESIKETKNELFSIEQQITPIEEKKASNIHDFKDFFSNKSPQTSLNSSNFQSDEFFNVVRAFISSSNITFDQFINMPNICDVVSKSVSIINNQSDIELMVKFIEFLKEKQTMYQDQVTRILHAIVCGNDQNINYIISISKYFSDSINDLNFQEIISMLRIIDAIMRNGSNEQNDKAFQFIAPSILNHLENKKIKFADLDISKLTLNPDYIARYLSQNSSVINVMVFLVTKIACLNINFKKDSEKVFQRYLYYSNSSDGTGYYCATILVYYCFNDKNKKENDIVRYLNELFKHLSRFHNKKWRNTFFKAFINLVNNDPNSVPNWAKSLVNDSFKFASLICDNEKAFFRIVFKEMNIKEFSAFFFNYSKSFSSDFYKMSWITSSDNKIKAINQLEQLVFLMNEFPDEKENIIQFLDIKKEWFRNLDFQKYKKLILPSDL